ncbi:hypothetical protein [Afipia felis]|uniref:hypothetical protein n=1 Tax=Afipia felis TaxID=1035 RepID=UPI0011C06B3E|nr:hypothetical protein [Afipia felis]
MSIPRVIRGKHPVSGNYGIYVSKPGIYVTTAQPGQFVYDSSSIAYQKVLNGTTEVLRGKAPNVAQANTVSLPSEYAAYSHLQMWASVTMWLYNSSSGNSNQGDAAFDGLTRLDMKIVSGALTLTCTSAEDTRTAGGAIITQFYFVANWAIFNARVDA